jgi:hypothetical protein
MENLSFFLIPAVIVIVTLSIILRIRSAPTFESASEALRYLSKHDPKKPRGGDTGGNLDRRRG